MLKKQNLYIGVMTGTSLDAVEVALLAFETDDAGLERGLPVVMQHYQAPYPEALRQAVLAINQGQRFTMQQYGYVDTELAKICAAAIESLLQKADIEAAQVMAVGLHGQTVHHQPNGAEHEGVRFTLQLGDPHIVATQLAIPVVADFRRRDMALGGQGAPLACGFHDKVWRSSERIRVVLNLGGIANITVLEPGKEAYGFDTGPANILLDAWVQQHQGQAYDADGKWARGGAVIPSLLKTMLADPYFAQAWPKSTGREHFNEAWLERHLAHHRQANSEAQDADDAQAVQATLLELSAQSIAQQIQLCTQASGLAMEVIVCGGGAYNLFLCERLQALCAPAEVRSSADFGFAPEAIEAAAFAFFAQQTWRGLAANIPSVTGASRPCLLGNIVLP